MCALSGNGWSWKVILATQRRPLRNSDQVQKVRVRDWDRSTFPALYRSADDASINSQLWYLRWFRVNLGLLVVGALAGSISLSDVGQRRIVQGAAAICFFLALATTMLLANRRWERVWYAGRAVAESVKSLTWKFMMGANPFPVTQSQAEAVEEFTQTLEELLRENRHLAAALSGEDASGEQVTPHMTRMREAAVGVLRDVYFAQRVDDQQAWYASSSAMNRNYRNTWFALLVLFQAAAGIAAIVLTIKPMIPWRELSHRLLNLAE